MPCWFARDVTEAMLVVKNKSISLLWELNSIFMSILREKIFIVSTLNMVALSRGCKPRLGEILSFLAQYFFAFAFSLVQNLVLIPNKNSWFKNQNKFPCMTD